MTKQAWFCPACQRHHAPHVETCPKPADLIGYPLPIGPSYPIPMAPDYNPCANCKGACSNAACPKRIQFTSTASPYDVRTSLSGTCQQMDGH